MADIFISYSSADELLARFVFDHLKTERIEAYMASASLQPGQRWTEAVFAELRQAKWVVFLASRAACQSAYVQQELGAALIQEKNVLPIVWDMPPSEVPGWVKQHHVLNLAGRTDDDLKSEVSALAERVRQDKRNGLFVVGAIALGLMALSK